MKLSALLEWADRYPFFFFLLQNDPYDDLWHYRWVMGVGRFPHRESLQGGHWYMGGWTYEWQAPYKKPLIEFPKAAFFVPQLVIAQDEAPAWEEEDLRAPVRRLGSFQTTLTKAQFLERVQRLRDHIYHGEVYQVNLSFGLWWEHAVVDPLLAYRQLLAAFPAGYNYLFKYQQKYVIGASPERFFWQWRGLIAQQPIKGTIRRGATWEEDLQQVEKLRGSPKELAENTMIVDLVRNDLSRVCVPGTVQVAGLAFVRSYANLHHLISTVYGEREKDLSWVKAAASLFPAGSMTGAPKRAAMHYIHEYEPVGRGLYSGAVGYISPEGQADFAVGIRSWIYDSAARQLLLQVGSGITYDSDPLSEWEESWVKAEKLLEALQVSSRVLRS